MGNPQASKLSEDPSIMLMSGGHTTVSGANVGGGVVGASVGDAVSGGAVGASVGASVGARVGAAVGGGGAYICCRLSGLIFMLMVKAVIKMATHKNATNSVTMVTRRMFLKKIAQSAIFFKDLYGCAVFCSFYLFLFFFLFPPHKLA